jgi:hypothetical protein
MSDHIDRTNVRVVRVDVGNAKLVLGAWLSGLESLLEHHRRIGAGACGAQIREKAIPIKISPIPNKILTVVL